MAAAPLVAIIDDDDSLRVALVDLIRSLGSEAKGFASAEGFTAVGAQRWFFGVVTGIQITGMSGIELKLALTARQNNVPVIMITARSEPAIEEKARTGGAACYLKKPFSADEIIACIGKALKL